MGHPNGTRTPAEGLRNGRTRHGVCDDRGDGMGGDLHTIPMLAEEGVEVHTPLWVACIEQVPQATPWQRGRVSLQKPPRPARQPPPTTTHPRHGPWKKRSNCPNPATRAAPMLRPVSSDDHFGGLASAAPCEQTQAVAPCHSLRPRQQERQEERKNPNSEPSATWCVSSQQAATEAALEFHCEALVLSGFDWFKALPNVTEARSWCPSLATSANDRPFGPT